MADFEKFDTDAFFRNLKGDKKSGRWYDALKEKYNPKPDNVISLDEYRIT
ncbi:MAG: hypothetical protein GY941_17050 [Planctomycetes bacterium]|nr:hypothetical protein [Planctomycetota bacterium]